MTFWGITRLNKEHLDPFLDLAEIIYGSLGANGLNTVKYIQCFTEQLRELGKSRMKTLMMKSKMTHHPGVLP